MASSAYPFEPAAGVVGQTGMGGERKPVKLTKARPGDVLERRGEHGEVVVGEVVNVFTASEPGGAGNVRCADYRANGGAGEMYRMRADQDPDVWTLVDACAECGQRRRMAGSEWCEACRQQNGKLE